MEACSVMTPIEALDDLGVAMFAATGAFAASRKQLDFIGFIFLGPVQMEKLTKTITDIGYRLST